MEELNYLDPVCAYLKSERQWSRYSRIRKARMMLRNSISASTSATENPWLGLTPQFWTEVLNRLGPLPPPPHRWGKKEEFET